MKSVVKSYANASVKQRMLPVPMVQDEPVTGERAGPSSPQGVSLMAQVLERENLIRALKQVQLRYVPVSMRR